MGRECISLLQKICTLAQALPVPPYPMLLKPWLIFCTWYPSCFHIPLSTYLLTMGQSLRSTSTNSVPSKISLISIRIHVLPRWIHIVRGLIEPFRKNSLIFIRIFCLMIWRNSTHSFGNISTSTTLNGYTGLSTTRRLHYKLWYNLTIIRLTYLWSAKMGGLIHQLDRWGTLDILYA